MCLEKRIQVVVDNSRHRELMHNRFTTPHLPLWAACHSGKPDKCAAVKRSFGSFRGCGDDFCLEGLMGFDSGRPAVYEGVYFDHVPVVCEVVAEAR